MLSTVPTPISLLFQGWSNSERLELNTFFLTLNTPHLWRKLFFFFWSQSTSFIYNELHITSVFHFFFFLVRSHLPYPVLLQYSYFIPNVAIFHYVFPFSAEKNQIKSIMAKKDSKTIIYWLKKLTQFSLTLLKFQVCVPSWASVSLSDNHWTEFCMGPIA